MKMCPYCTKEVQDDAVKCKHCGGWFANNAEVEQKKMDDQKRVEKMIQGKEDKAAGDIGEQTEYFSVPTTKLIVMCVLSFGIYEVYWFYKNWKAVVVQEQKKMRPFWRAIFALFYCYSLFKRILISAVSKGYQTKMSYTTLTVCYIVITMLHRLPDPFWLASFFTFIPLVYVADAIRYNNAQLNPEFADSSKWTRKDIIFAVFGILLWVSTVYGFRYPLDSQV